MNPNTDLRIEQAKREVLRDIAEGVVPVTVGTFAELHDHVDANYYGGLFDLADAELAGGADSTSEALQDFANDVQDAVDRWLRAGGHR